MLFLRLLSFLQNFYQIDVLDYGIRPLYSPKGLFKAQPKEKCIQCYHEYQCIKKMEDQPAVEPGKHKAQCTYSPNKTEEIEIPGLKSFQVERPPGPFDYLVFVHTIN